MAKKSIAVFFSLLILLISAFPVADAFATPISEFVTVYGVKCRPRQNLLTYLFLGIDDDGKVVEKDDNAVGGECDVVVLLVIDKAANTYAKIVIDRDTMCDVHMITCDGTDYGIFRQQIALSHSRGNGLAQSCLNTVKSVESLLQGVTVDHYMSANMDVIQIFNHALGGVTVTLEDDMTVLDPELTPGSTVILSDSQAVSFVRSRMGIGDGKNTSRIRRQQQYIDAALPLLKERSANDKSFVLDLVHSMSDYTVTDMVDKDFSYIAKAVTKNQDLGTFRLSGTSEIDSNGWNAFYPDEESISQLVIDLFYHRVEE